MSAQRLRCAARVLRDRAEAATPGPWDRPLNTRTKSTVWAELPDDEPPGTWVDGINPTTGDRERLVVATIPTWSNGSHVRKRGGRDLTYIATMNPGVGIALANLLDKIAARCGSLQVEPGQEELTLAAQILGTDDG